jgi:PAS domain S-box-containing protein
LHVSERHFRSLIENAQDIITILDPAGTIVYESPSLERVFGYNPVDMIGRNAFEFVHPDDVKQVFTAFREAAENPLHRSVTEFRFRHRDGSWRILEAIGSVMREGSVVQGLWSIRAMSPSAVAPKKHYVKAKYAFAPHPTAVSTPFTFLRACETQAANRRLRVCRC